MTAVSSGFSDADAFPLLICSSFTATPVSQAINFWARLAGVEVEQSVASYGQVFQTLHALDGTDQRARSAVAALLRMEDFIRAAEPPTAESLSNELGAALAAAGRRCPLTIFLVAVCPPSLAVLLDATRARHIDTGTRLLREYVQAIPNLVWLEPYEVQGRYAVERVNDTYADGLGNIPYTPEYFDALGTALMRRLWRAFTRDPKLIVVDGDNTLWDGILGEDGVSGVAVGCARQEVQMFLLQQRRAGRLLALCSKNDEADVLAALDAISDMQVKADDFVCVRANWWPKSSHVQELASCFGFELETIVLIDDSPTECAEVRAACPGVVTLQLPSNASLAMETLQHFWPLDVESRTVEASRRTAYYRQDQLRWEHRRKRAGSLQDFIESLELEVTFRSAESWDHPRVVELMRRTSQFNLTVTRQTAGEIQAVPDALERLVVEAKDRFGNYGTVGLLIFLPDDGGLTVSTFLLSCRALGRGVEHRMLAHLGQVALARHIDKIRLRYVPTTRNLPARTFVDDVAVLEAEAGDGTRVYAVGAREAAEARWVPSAPMQVGSTLVRAAVPIPADATAHTDTQDELYRAAMALTTGAKIRAAILNAAAQGAPDQLAPVDDERTVLRIWSEVLEVPAQYVRHSFDALGGGSLELVQLVASVYEAFGVEIPLDRLLENVTFTLSDVVALVRELRGSGEGLSANTIPWLES